MEGPENLPQAEHSGGSHWLEPAKSGRRRSLGESEEGGKQDEGGVCVYVGVESLCRKQPSGSLPC